MYDVNHSVVVLNRYIFTTDHKNIVDRLCNTHDNDVNETGWHQGCRVGWRFVCFFIQS